jgi:hypothetical protein
VDFVVELIQTGTEKKFCNQFVFDPGLRHGNGAIKDFTGSTATKTFKELQVRGRKMTLMPGKQ